MGTEERCWPAGGDMGGETGGCGLGCGEGVWCEAAEGGGGG